MNFFSNPTLEPYERLPDFVMDGLPQEVRDAITTLRRARNEAADQIERLLSFLDETEFDIDENELDRMLAERFGEAFRDDESDVDREPDVDCELSGDECEPSLGANPSTDQAHWGHGGAGDLELDTSDDEPSLCGVTVERGDDRDIEVDLGTFDRMVDQTRSTQIYGSPDQWPVIDGEAACGPA